MFDKTLLHIAIGFTIREIMIPGKRLVTASDLPSAVQLLKEHPDFNLIPIQNPHGRLVAFVDRHNSHEQTFNLHHHIVSDSMSILEIVDILKDREFCFVMVDNKIGGYIHFSDLNSRTAELAFYILTQAVEHHLLVGIRHHINLESLDQVLGEERAKFIKRNFERHRKNDAFLDLLRELYIDDILKYARHYRIFDMSDNEINEIKQVRDSVSHAAPPLITVWNDDKQLANDIKRLARVKESCYEILGISKDSHTPTRR